MNGRMRAQGAAWTGGASLLVRYGLFAAAATLVNLATQAVAFRLSPIAELPVSILAGTAAGFAAKYVLDKLWIFDDGYAGGREEARKIVLYGAFSVLTTLVFWGFEAAFWMTWRTDLAKYAGAVIGLAIGYAAKYSLDRAFVFRTCRA
jgi:putative flippase GtrA